MAEQQESSLEIKRCVAPLIETKDGDVKQKSCGSFSEIMEAKISSM